MIDHILEPWEKWEHALQEKDREIEWVRSESVEAFKVEIANTLAWKQRAEKAEARLEKVETHDVTHPGPCCVRAIRRVDIKGIPLSAARPEVKP